MQMLIPSHLLLYITSLTFSLLFLFLTKQMRSVIHT